MAGQDLIDNELARTRLIKWIQQDVELQEIIHAPPYPLINENQNGIPQSQDDYKKMNEEKYFLFNKIGCRIAKNKRELFDLLNKEFKINY